jgi:hypothetical protein
MNRMLAFVGLVCAVSPIFGHRTRVDFDHAIHFSCYRTYRWAPSPGAQAKGEFPNQLMQERIAGFIEEQLAARNIKRVATGGDLLLSYRVDVKAEPVFTTLSDGGGCGWGCGWGGGWGGAWGAGWGGGWGWSTTTVQTIYYGTLVVDMVDANRNELVFQGTSTHSISSRPEKNTQKLSKAVAEVFERYPPRP